MATTAEINDLLEPLLKNTDIASELQKKVKDVYSSLLDNLKRNAAGIKFETGTINLDGMFGVDKKISIANASKYVFLQRTILSKIESAVKTSNIQISSDGIKLGDILGAGPKDTIFTSMKFNALRKKVLNSLITQLDDKNLKFISPDQKIDLGNILGTSSKDSIFVSLKFNALRKKILNSLITQLDDKTLKFVSPGGLTIGSILGETPQMGILNKLKLSKLRGKILSVIESQITPGGGDSSGKGIRVFEEEAKPVRIVDFEGDAESDLKKILGTKDAIKGVDKKDQDKPALGGSKLLLSILGPLLLGVGGAIALFKGFDDEGPLKGAKILIGKLGVLGSLKWLQGSFTKLAGKFTGFLSKLPKFLVEPIESFIGGAVKMGSGFLAKIGGGLAKIPIVGMLGKLGGKILKGLKFIPFVGSIIDFYDAYTRFKQGKWGTGILSLLTGILGLIPGVGTAIKIAASIGVGIFNAIADSKESDKEKAPEAKKFSLKEFTSKILGKVTDWFKSTSIFKVGQGIYKIFTGRVGEGFQQMGDVLSGLPIIGKPIASLLSILQAKTEQITTASGNKGKSLMEIIKEYLINKVKSSFNRLLLLGTGLKKIFTGKPKEGLKDVFNALSDLPVIGAPMRTVKGWFDQAKEKAATSADGEKPVSIFQAFKEVVYEKIKKGLSNIPWWLKKVLSYIPGLKNIIGQVKDVEESFEESSFTEKDGERLKELQKRREEGNLGKGWGSAEEQAAELKALEEKAAKQQSQQTVVNDASGFVKRGTRVGSFKGKPVVTGSRDFLTLAKEGGPIEKSMKQLVNTVSTKMEQLTKEIATNLKSGISSIQPTVVPVPPPAVNIPAPQSPPLESGKAPSYAMGKIYNQRAKFYAIYGGT